MKFSAVALLIISMSSPWTARAESYDCRNSDGSHEVHVAYIPKYGKGGGADIWVNLADKGYRREFHDSLADWRSQPLRYDSFYNPDFFSVNGGILGGVYRINLDAVKMSAEIIYKADALSVTERFTGLRCLAKR